MTGQDGTPAALPAAGLAAPATGSSPVGNRLAAFSDYDRAVWAWICSWPFWSAPRYDLARRLGLFAIAVVTVCSIDPMLRLVQTTAYELGWTPNERDQRLAQSMGMPELAALVPDARSVLEPRRPITSSVLKELLPYDRDWSVSSCGDTGPRSAGRDIVVYVSYPECYSEQESLRVIGIVWRRVTILLATQGSQAKLRVYVTNEHGQFALAKGPLDPKQKEGGLGDALVKFTK